MKVHTMQETFDIVAKHLWRQGQAAMSETGEACVYRGAGGSKCAIGALIHNDEYDEYIEDHPVSMLKSKIPSLFEHHPALLVTSLREGYMEEIAFGDELQQLHDSFNIRDFNFNFVEQSLEKELRSIALNHNLTMPELKPEDFATWTPKLATN
jgi:hypothetical protein